MIAPFYKGGDKIGWWTISHLVPAVGGRKRYLCVCKCGKLKIVRQAMLKRGSSKSCGCLAVEVNRKKVKHGQWRTPEYSSWDGMIQRCSNSKRWNYRYWGGRGIKVCRRWRKFENFFRDMGRKPTSKHQIDRINVNGNYEPGNCRWATPKEQARNKRRRKT